ncbi:unnamed protein product, partial [Urochloa humidicola]
GGGDGDAGRRFADAEERLAAALPPPPPPAESAPLAADGVLVLACQLALPAPLDL